MWIMTQLKNTIVNSDNMHTIFIDRQKGFIKARLDNSPEGIIALGNYDKDKIDLVFNDILSALTYGLECYRMPFGGEVEKNDID